MMLPLSYVALSLFLTATLSRINADFNTAKYSVSDKSVEEQFCGMLTLTCPFLRSRKARPSPSQSVPVALNVTFEPKVFIGIDDPGMTFSVQASFHFTWQLPQCAQWNNNASVPALPTNPDVAQCSFRPDEMWVPTIVHKNSVGFRDPFKKDLNRELTLSSNGVVRWTIFNRFDSSCVLSFKKFPFDRQNCEILLSPILDASADLYTFSNVLFNQTCDSDLFAGLFQNSIWECVSTSYVIDRKNNMVSFKFEVLRRGDSFLTRLFIPITILTVLQQSTLAIHPDSSDRAGFSMTVFLALAFFQNSFSSFVPQTAEVISVNVYFIVQMMIGVAITVYSLIICRVFTNDKNLQRKIWFCPTHTRVVDLLDIAMFLVCLTANVATNIILYINVTTPDV